MDILNEVFARQYAQLRYGETNNVIKFFEREVARLYRILTNAEDDLIRYNVEKRIINYGEQTKQLAGLDASQKVSDNTLLIDKTTTRALMDYLERQLGDRAKIMDIMRQKLDKEILYYAPIGATIARKDRHISFIEGNYMEMLKALNAARLRQKNLQMTTATLRVLNPPMFPMNAQPTNRMMILLGAFMLTFVLTAMYFFIIELLDRTLRDRMRSERITKIPVMGCFPKESTLRYRRFNKTIADMALRQLSKALLPHFKEGQQNVLNLLSTDAANGKSFVAQELENYWISIGLTSSSPHLR